MRTRTNPYETKRFKKLKDRWEEKLEGEGLGEHLPSGNPYRGGTVGHDATTWEAKVRYYARLTWKATEAEFLTTAGKVDKTVMTMRADGATIVEISRELAKRRTARAKSTIRFIIRRWEKEWGLRDWTDAQLGKRKKV